MEARVTAEVALWFLLPRGLALDDVGPSGETKA